MKKVFASEEEGRGADNTSQKEAIWSDDVVWQRQNLYKIRQNLISKFDNESWGIFFSKFIFENFFQKFIAEIYFLKLKKKSNFQFLLRIFF